MTIACREASRRILTTTSMRDHKFWTKSYLGVATQNNWVEGMKLSVVVPARNEKENIEFVVRQIVTTLRVHGWGFELILIDDNSTDSTGEKMERLAARYSSVRVIHRDRDPGLGNALRAGFRLAKADVVIPFMGDMSDDPRDIPKLVEKVQEGYDVVVGSRFVRGGSVEDYPPMKLILNRAFNWLVHLLFGFQAMDLTNAFKAYRREVIAAIKLESRGFEITAELPLKAFLAGYKIVEVPVRWRGRRAGVSKLNLTRMGPQYLRTVLKIFFQTSQKNTRAGNESSCQGECFLAFRNRDDDHLAAMRPRLLRLQEPVSGFSPTMTRIWFCTHILRQILGQERGTYLFRNRTYMNGRSQLATASTLLLMAGHVRCDTLGRRRTREHESSHE